MINVCATLVAMQTIVLLLPIHSAVHGQNMINGDMTDHLYEPYKIVLCSHCSCAMPTHLFIGVKMQPIK